LFALNNLLMEYFGRKITPKKEFENGKLYANYGILYNNMEFCALDMENCTDSDVKFVGAEKNPYFCRQNRNDYV